MRRYCNQCGTEVDFVGYNGNSHAVLWGNSHAELWENSHAELRENSHAVLGNEGSHCGGEVMNEFMIVDNQVPEQALVTLKEHNKGFLAWAGREDIQIETDEQQTNIQDLLILGRRAQKEVEATLKEYTDPIRAAEKAVRDRFKPYQNLLELVCGRMAQADSAYRQKKTKAIEEARIEAMKAQAAQITEAKDTGEVVDLPTEVIKPIEKTSHANVGTVTYRKDFDIQVVNPDLVPRDLCVPDMVKIRARVKSGVLEIPGCLITQKEIQITRPG